jgi:hypothetical protein
MPAKKKRKGAGHDETELRSEWVKGVRTVEFPEEGSCVRFVTDSEYRRVMKARGYDPDADLSEFMDAEDFTGAIRVRIDGEDGMLCTA